MSESTDAVYTHTHKYFLFETKTNFEPYATQVSVDGNPLYERIEYAIMACNCAAVVKVKVKQKDNA